MDSTDLSIIRLLMQDAQMPFNKIAKKLGIGTDTVIRRYRRLKNEGIIHHPAIIVNIEKCGYEGHVFFFISTLPGADISHLYDQLSQMKNVMVVVMTIGDYDLHVYGIYADSEDLMRLYNELSSLAGIEDIAMASMPAKSFETLPSISYYSKAISNDITDEPKQG
jgi:Lrp/AsnC family transcriptional regulator, regulator for asnA, asnC and gidA